jgi:glycosyltransferase involved in cell wall biosynthesis
MTEFSVMICTYNRPELLRQALAALIDKTWEKPDEIVIVNGGDATASEIAVRYASRDGISVKVIETVNKNLAASRNLGLRACTGRVVAMTDDDAEVFPDWVSRIKSLHLEHPEAGAVGGAVIGAQSGTSFLSRVSDVVTFVSPAKSCYVRTLPGVNVSYKREILQKVGPQDETLFRGEDVDFNWRVKRLGYEILYDPSVKVLHHHRPKLKGMLCQHYMYGRAYYLVRRKWPEMYCVYPHAIHSLRDFLRAGYFLLCIVLQPIQQSFRMPRLYDKFFAVPILIMIQLAWKIGMLTERLITCYHWRNCQH